MKRFYVTFCYIGHKKVCIINKEKKIDFLAVKNKTVIKMLKFNFFFVLEERNAFAQRRANLCLRQNQAFLCTVPDSRKVSIHTYIHILHREK